MSAIPKNSETEKNNRLGNCSLTKTKKPGEAMEYKKDLPKNNSKSIFRLILGISMCLLSVVWIFARLADNDLIRPFDWIYSGFFALSGVTHIFTGVGTSIERFFGK